MLKRLVQAVLLGLTLLAGSAQALMVELVGGSVRYTFDDRQPALALLGTPSLDGDTLRFTPSDLSVATPDDGAFGVDTQRLKFGVRVEALRGGTLSRGSGQVGGLHQETVFFEGAAARTGFAYAITVGGNPVESGQIQFGPETSPAFAGYDVWALNSNPSLSGQALDLGFDFFLAAARQGPASAGLSVTRFDFTPGAFTPVPLPPAVWLLLSAVLGLFALGRRRVAA